MSSVEESPAALSWQPPFQIRLEPAGYRPTLHQKAVIMHGKKPAAMMKNRLRSAFGRLAGAVHGQQIGNQNALDRHSLQATLRNRCARQVRVHDLESSKVDVVELPAGAIRVFDGGSRHVDILERAACEVHVAYR